MRIFTLIAAMLLCSIAAMAQSAITGTISDTNGEPLPGATVMLKGTAIATATDADGFYMFNRLENGTYTVIASFVGLSSGEKTVTVNGRTNIDIDLAQNTYTTDAITVSANRVSADAPITHTNMNKEAIEAHNLGQDVPFLLRWTPSVVVTSDAGAGVGYTGIRLRGSDASRVNITINGIPLNDSESQGTFWVNLPDFSSSTDNIQIQRGVGTSTNGAGAFGGTINLSTLNKNDDWYTEINGTYGSFNTLKGNVQFGTGLLGEKFTIDGRVSHIQSDGYIDRATADLNSFFVSAAYWGEKNSLVINSFAGHEVTYQAWNGLPYQYINDPDLRTFNSSGMERADTPHDNEVDDYYQHHNQLLYNHQLSTNWDLKASLHYTRGKGFFEQYKGDQDLADYGLDSENSDLIRRRWLDNHFYGLTYTLNYRQNDFGLTIGGAANKYDGRHFGEVIWTTNGGDQENPPIYYDNDAEKIESNIFAQANYQLSKSLNLFADLQYRFINYEFLGLDVDGNPLAQDDQLHFVNPKLGLTYNFSNTANLYAYAGIAQREPNRTDYTESSINSRPKSELLLDYELGYRQQWNRSYLGANLYFMDYYDQLVLTGQLNDVGEYTRTNVERSYRAGIELEGHLQLNDYIGLSLNATLSQNKIKSFTEYIDNWDTWGQEVVSHRNTDLAFSPNVISAAQLTYNVLPKNEMHDLSLSILQKVVGDQYIDNTSSKHALLKSYNNTNINLKYAIKPKFVETIELNLLVRNVFDQLYVSNAWNYRFTSPSYNPVPDDPYARAEGNDIYNLTGLFPQAGINFLVGLRVRF